MCVINKDYMGVVSIKEGQFLEYNQIPIDNPNKELCDVLEDMNRNDNRTVLDMQDRFTSVFRRCHCEPVYNFCYPHSYASSYLSKASYPQIYSYDEYKKALKDDNNGSTQKFLKKSFLDDCKRYIYACNYHRMLERLKSDGLNRMFSSENIGWTSYEYTVNEDIVFSVESNFGFGNSSYFFVNMRYKGVDILPFSDCITYYNTNMIEFIRYTRQYYLTRDNWNTALDFVVNTSNQAAYSEEEFINKWIFNEIEEMMSGLERLVDNPKLELDKHKAMKDRPDLRGLISIRHINGSEIGKYSVYTSEMVVAYQAEKITGALFLMEKLEKFNTIYPKVLNVINRIREINISFYPIFASAIERTEAKKVPIQQNIDNEIKEKEEIISKCVPFEEEMQQILRQKQLEKENSEESVSEYSMHSIRSIYANEHENYKSLLSEIGGINSKIREKEDAIRDLDGFVRQLSICLKYIDQYTNVVA